MSNHLRPNDRNGTVWQSPLFRKLFSFTCKIELALDDNLKLFLDCILTSYLCWAKYFDKSTCTPTFPPSALTSSSTFCPQIHKELLFSTRAVPVSVVLVAPLRIRDSAKVAWTPNSTVSILGLWSLWITLLLMSGLFPLK